jgi:DNA polymerase IV (DinB-like DNA polymerase)
LTQYLVGCAGWKFGAGNIDFYPDSLEPGKHLSYYSRVFDIVEVGLPADYFYRFSLKKWAADTPDEFRFVVRLPRHVLLDVERALGPFLEGLSPVEPKVLAVVVETPPGVPLALEGGNDDDDEGARWLEGVLDTCAYHGYSVLADLAHPSWFQDKCYKVLKSHGAGLYWSNSRPGRPRAAVTSDLICLRLAAKDGWRLWVEKARDEAADDRRVEAVAIIADSPSLANAALEVLGMPARRYGGAGSLSPTPALLAPPENKKSVAAWSGGRAVACVDLNAFYPSCEELREPSLRGRPHAVIMTDQPTGRITRGVVSSCSYAARRFGVRSAMPLSRALALCPDLILRPVDMPYYKEVSGRVMEVLAGFASVLEQASIDEAFLDCTASLAAGDPAEEYGARIHRAIKERCGLASSVGIAPTKSAAKIACDHKNPDGITIVRPETLQDFLAPLGVGRISGIGPKTQKELKRLGIETIGQLAGYDVQKLMARFGRNGLWMWQVATGQDGSPVEPREDHVSVSTERSLERHAKSREEVVAHLNGLVDELYERIARRGYMFRTVGVKLVRSDFTIESRELSFPSARAGREAIASAIPQLADRFSYDAPGNGGGVAAIRKVGLRVTNLSARQEAQKTLLDFTLDGQ